MSSVTSSDGTRMKQMVVHLASHQEDVLKNKKMAYTWKNRVSLWLEQWIPFRVWKIPAKIEKWEELCSSYRPSHVSLPLLHHSWVPTLWGPGLMPLTTKGLPPFSVRESPVHTLPRSMIWNKGLTPSSPMLLLIHEAEHGIIWKSLSWATRNLMGSSSGSIIDSLYGLGHVSSLLWGLVSTSVEKLFCLPQSYSRSKWNDKCANVL